MCERKVGIVAAAAAAGMVVAVLWQSRPIMCAGNDFIRRPCRSPLPGNCDRCQGLEGGMKRRERLGMSPESPLFIWRLMERSKSTAVSQVGPRAKASGSGGRVDGASGRSAAGVRERLGFGEDRA